MNFLKGGQKLHISKGAKQNSKSYFLMSKFSAMLMQNFSVQVEDFKSPNKIPKPYTLGVIFESYLIEQKITSI